MRHPLVPVLVLTLVLSLACMPPATYGLRSAGDLSEPGTTEIGAGLGVAESGFGVLSVDASHTLAEHVGVAGSVGFVTGSVQAQSELRFSTDRTGRFGLTGIVGAAGITSGLFTAGGPYTGGSLRFGDPGRGFVYTGAKVNPVFNVGPPQVWLTPALGVSTAGRRWRVGAEGIAFVPLVMPSIYAGMGGQIYLSRRFGEGPRATP